MSLRNNTSSGIVYSTDPAFKPGAAVNREQTLPAALQQLRVRLETKHRGGKAVTVILNFQGTDADAEALGKALKSHCGTGGTVKDKEILVQGDNREKVLQWLLKNGYKSAK